MLRILVSGCAVAEFRGTFGSNADFLKRYAYSRNSNNPETGNAQKANVGLGRSNAHRFVVFSSTGTQLSGLKQYIRRNKLGKIWVSDTVANNNHGGWNDEAIYSRQITCYMYQPDHEALTAWVQKKYNKDYKLE